MVVAMLVSAEAQMYVAGVWKKYHKLMDAADMIDIFSDQVSWTNSKILQGCAKVSETTIESNQLVGSLTGLLLFFFKNCVWLNLI